MSIFKKNYDVDDRILDEINKVNEEMYDQLMVYFNEVERLARKLDDDNEDKEDLIKVASNYRELLEITRKSF